MEILNEKAKSHVYEMLKNEHRKIEVMSGECRFNYKCHMNSVHEAINNNDDRIAMCMYIDGDYPIIHFLNINKKGEFIDNTLGNWSTIYDYYFIREIKKKDFFKINSIFVRLRRDLRDKLPFWTRLLSDTEF